MFSKIQSAILAIRRTQRSLQATRYKWVIAQSSRFNNSNKQTSSVLFTFFALFFFPGAFAKALAQSAENSGAATASRGFIDPAGPVAAAQFSHFSTVSLIMAAVVILPIFIAIPFILLRYRRGARGAYKPDWEFNWGVELFIWGLPVAIIIVLATVLWKDTHKYDPYAPLGHNSLQIQVVSLDWKFLFLYPEQGVATVNQLVLPEQRPVTLTLTSGTVMQSFMVPRLAGQIYTMAGMKTKLNLLADAPGTYLGRNMQYNGTGFAAQSFTTQVMTESHFTAWVNDMQKESKQLNWQGYEALLKPSIEKPIRYASYDPDLFNKIIASFAPEQHSTATYTKQSHSHTEVAGGGQ